MSIIKKSNNPIIQIIRNLIIQITRNPEIQITSNPKNIILILLKIYKSIQLIIVINLKILLIKIKYYLIIVLNARVEL